MDGNTVSAIGFVAAICTSISALPQVIKTIKTKKTEDISFWMYALLIVGVFLWLIYGILTQDAPIYVANSITFLIVGIVLACKIKYG